MIKKLIERIKKSRNVFPTSEYVIEWKFAAGGVDYYGFADLNNLPYKRGLMALAIYNELDMRCSREYLLKHTKAVEDVLKAQEIDIFKIKRLNEQMQQRLSLNTETDLMYKVASVAFFDKKENPESYDAAYAEKKIQHWKKCGGVADFFLQQPLMELLPYCRNVDTDLDSFSILNEKLNEIHSEYIRMLSSSSQ